MPIPLPDQRVALGAVAGQEPLASRDSIPVEFGVLGWSHKETPPLLVLGSIRDFHWIAVTGIKQPNSGIVQVLSGPGSPSMLSLEAEHSSLGTSIWNPLCGIQTRAALPADPTPGMENPWMLPASRNPAGSGLRGTSLGWEHVGTPPHSLESFQPRCGIGLFPPLQDQPGSRSITGLG